MTSHIPTMFYFDYIYLRILLKYVIKYVICYIRKFIFSSQVYRIIPLISLLIRNKRKITSFYRSIYFRNILYDKYPVIRNTSMIIMTNFRVRYLKIPLFLSFLSFSQKKKKLSNTCNQLSSRYPYSMHFIFCAVHIL